MLCRILPGGKLFIFVEMIVDANSVLSMSLANYTHAKKCLA